MHFAIHCSEGSPVCQGDIRPMEGGVRRLPGRSESRKRTSRRVQRRRPFERLKERARAARPRPQGRLGQKKQRHTAISRILGMREAQGSRCSATCCATASKSCGWHRNVWCGGGVRHNRPLVSPLCIPGFRKCQPRKCVWVLAAALAPSCVVGMFLFVRIKLADLPQVACPQGLQCYCG